MSETNDETNNELNDFLPPQNNDSTVKKKKKYTAFPSCGYFGFGNKDEQHYDLTLKNMPSLLKTACNAKPSECKKIEDYGGKPLYSKCGITPFTASWLGPVGSTPLEIKESVSDLVEKSQRLCQALGEEESIEKFEKFCSAINPSKPDDDELSD